MRQKTVSDVVVSDVEASIKNGKKKKKVTLVGFGIFEPRKRAARKGRNPQTGEAVNIPAKVVPGFTAGKNFKECVK